MFGIKPKSTLDRINEQIYEGEKALIENQGTAEHYQALADGNKKTLARLEAMKAKIQKGDVIVLDAESGLLKPSTKTKLRAA